MHFVVVARQGTRKEGTKEGTKEGRRVSDYKGIFQGRWLFCMQSQEVEVMAAGRAGSPPPPDCPALPHTVMYVFSV